MILACLTCRDKARKMAQRGQNNPVILWGWFASYSLKFPLSDAYEMAVAEVAHELHRRSLPSSKRVGLNNDSQRKRSKVAAELSAHVQQDSDDNVMDQVRTPFGWYIGIYLCLLQPHKCPC